MYNALCAFALIISCPFLFLLSFKRKFHISSKKGVKNSLLARFFLWKNPPLKPVKYHFHACSLGEVISIENLVKELAKNESVAISTITSTGYAKAQEICENSALLPFECFLPFWLEKCEILVVFEAELWLNLFKYAKKQGARVILLNARISRNSFASYNRLKFYYKNLFSFVDLTLAQSDEDKARLSLLGAKNIKVVGNIKSANTKKPTKIRSKNFEKIIIIASSHEGEEQELLKHFKLKDNEQLLIAPRHPQRFTKVEKIAKKWANDENFSFSTILDDDELKAKVVLINKLGELINLYAIANIVILAGSFKKNIGGHNPFEPANFNCGIISGEFFYNQKALYSCIENIKIVKNYDEINELIHQNFSSKIKQKCDFDEILNIIKGKNSVTSL